jgi:hypothetical protein
MWAADRPLRRARWALATGVALAASALGLSTATAGAAAPPTCALASPGLVGSVYGAKFGPVFSETKGHVTVCSYASTMSVISVLVRFQTGEDRADFDASRRQFDRRGEHTVNRPGFGQSSYSVVLGSGKTVTSTIVALTGSTELLVTGTGPLYKAEQLAKRVLANF